MDDILYLEEGKVKVSDTGMQIPEFKDYKQYDRSVNKEDFYLAMTYIFYVYKIFGNTKNMSPYSNMPLKQRQVYTCKNHTKGKGVDYFESNTRIKHCIDAYTTYSRTQAERMLDTFKQDMEDFIIYVQSIPTTITKTVVVRAQVPGEDRYENVDVEIDIPNLDIRMSTLKKAIDYQNMFNKWAKDAKNDGIKKNEQTRLYERPQDLEKVPLIGFSIANE